MSIGISFEAPLQLIVEPLNREFLSHRLEQDDISSGFSYETSSDFGIPVADDSELDSPSMNHSEAECNDTLFQYEPLTDDQVESDEKKIKQVNDNTVKYIQKELLSYEQRLVESLRILSVISDAIGKHSSWKDPTSLREIFKDMHSLYGLHQHLLADMEKVDHTEDNRILPSVFVNDSEIPYLNIYKSFLIHFAINNPKLGSLYKEDKTFNEVCRNVVQSTSNPEQRIQDVCGMYMGVHSSIPRFKLLLSRLERCFPDENENLKSVQKALKVFDQLLVYSESELVKQDRIQDAHAMFGKLEGLRLNFQQIPQLLREGPCKKIPRRSTQRRLLDRHLFLFSDYLVLTEPANNSGRFKVKTEAPSSGMRVTDLGMDEDFDFPGCLRIKTRNFCVELKFLNEAEKSAWYNQLHQVIRNEHPRLLDAEGNSSTQPMTSSMAAEWVKDEHSTMCAQCHSTFTLLNRKHHCRKCGKVFCGACSAFRAPIAFTGGKPQRVCIVDYYLIRKDLKPPNFDVMKSVQRRLKTGTIHDYSFHEKGYFFCSIFRYPNWSSKPIFQTTKQHTSRTIPVSSLIEKNSTSKSKKKYRLTLNPNASANQVTNPRNITVCLSRVFVVLDEDAILSIFAAKADNLAKETISLLGSRLAYMDSSDSTHSVFPRLRRSSCSSLRNHTAIDGHNEVDSALRQDTVGFTQTHPRLECTSPEAVSAMTSQIQSIYRHHNPPVGPKPKAELLSIAHRKIMLAQIKLQHTTNNFHRPIQRRSASIPMFEKLDLANGDCSSISTITTKSVSNLSINPKLSAVLHNRTGFLVLPSDNDQSAHYFEAQSVEIRSRWISAIRTVCAKVMITNENTHVMSL